MRVCKSHPPEIIQNEISIVVCCMNRNSNLIKSIKSWVVIKEVSEIIIVDWFSDIHVSDSLKEESIFDERIKIIRVYGKNKKWILTSSYNLAVDYASSQKILKLDSDNILHPEFFNEHDLQPSTFFSGDWENARNKNETHLNGVAYFYKEDFLKVGGYNELIQSYGWDDSDLYNRLENFANLKRLHIDNDYISHIEHTNEERGTVDTFKSIQCNRLLCELFPEEKRKRSEFSHVYTNLLQRENNRTLVKLKSIPTINSHILEKVNEEYERLYKNRKESHRESIEFFKNNVSHFVTSTKKIIFASVKNGIGNRLRALASLYNLYQKLNSQNSLCDKTLRDSQNSLCDKTLRDSQNDKNKTLRDSHEKGKSWIFFLIWIKDDHCNCEIEDLFDYDSNLTFFQDINIIRDEKVYEYLRNNLDKFPINTQQFSSLKSIEINKCEICDVDEAINLNIPYLYIESSTIIKSSHYSWKDDVTLLRSFVLSKHVLEILNKNQVNVSSLIGVCIREGQANVWDDTKNWDKNNQSQWEKHRGLSSSDRFIAHMKELPTDEKFFITGDKPETFDKLKEAFPGRVYYLERSVWDRSKEQIQIAFADILLLSKTKYVLGSNWSSYTELIKRFSDIKVKLAGSDF